MFFNIQRSFVEIMCTSVHELHSIHPTEDQLDETEKIREPSSIGRCLRS